MATEPTVRDALIAEILGDVGKLHDSVQELKAITPTVFESTKTGMSEILAALEKEVGKISTLVADSKSGRTRLDPAMSKKIMDAATQEITRQVKEQSLIKVQGAWKVKVATLLLSSTLLVGLAGLVVGAVFGPRYFPSIALTNEEQTQLKIGKNAMRLAQKWDKQSRENLLKLLGGD
jgi:hypothetical protein